MKRFILFTLCILLVLGSFAVPASANSWNLTGNLLKAVSSVKTWNDYYAPNKQIGDIAVMHSRYHNVLMLLLPGSGALHVYTKAVYQPDDGRDSEAKQSKTEDGFTLSYGDTERYTFYWTGEAYALKQAVIGDFSISLTDNGDGYGPLFQASEGTQRAILWRRDYPLNIFNIRLFPRSVDEVRQMNHMHAALDSGQLCLGRSAYPDDMPESTRKINVGTGTEPVYSAPYGEAAWRAANGKAAVGLSGELWTLKGLRTPDGNAWVCIRYDVSQRTQRIGYIPASVLGITVSEDDSTRDLLDRFLAVDVQAKQDTYLTDDPDVSQYPQFQVPEGTQFTCFGMFGSDYAYVAAEVKDGQFVSGGSIVWGFVPLKALSLSEGDPYRVQQTDVMATMIGEWVFAAGGSMAGDRLLFREDGTFTDIYEGMYPGDYLGEQQGTWSVTEYNPTWNLYWNNPPYELTLKYDSGRVNAKGLNFDGPWLSLTYYEGGGGYLRPEDARQMNED